MGDFEVETRLEPVEGPAGNTDQTARFRADLHEDWRIWGPNGGYVAAIALRAAGRVARVQRPASFSGHFLSVARFGPVDVEVTTLRAGRRAESFRVSIRQGERVILEALVRTAGEGPGLEHDVARFPDVPDPDSLKSREELQPRDGPDRHRFWNNFDVRCVYPERFLENKARDPFWHEWYRFRPRATFDDPFLDAGRLLLIVDTMSWPAACQPHVDAAYIAPNLEVSTWFHRFEPECDWLLGDHDCPVAENGLMGTHGRVWSRSGRLLASGGAQLLCTPRPPD